VRLFDVDRKTRWAGTRALALRANVECGCGPVYSGRFAQPALFFHGGYGATDLIRTTWCLCGRVNIRDVATVSPR